MRVIRVSAAADVRNELTRLLARQALRGRLLTLPGMPLVVLTLWPHVEHRALLTWLAIVVVEWCAGGVASVFPGRRIANGAAIPAKWNTRNAVFYASFGVAWGSLSLFSMSGTSPWSVWLGFVFVLAVLTAYVATAAGSRLMFAIGALPMIACNAVAISLSDGMPNVLLGASIGYAVVALGVHDELYRSLVSSVSSRFAAEKVSEQLNDFLAERDPATQLLNRGSFIGELDRQLGDQRHPVPIRLEIGNVCRLGTMNDLYGDAFGDALIAHVGSRLSAIDTAHGIAGRLGGDEFVVMWFDEAGSASMTDLVHGEFQYHGASCLVEIATATATSAVGTTADELLTTAMSTLTTFGGKRREREPRSREALDAERSLLAALDHGLRAAGVAPWFQPIVDPVTRKVVSWEALIRWNHPQRGMVGPERLLPHVELTGRSLELFQLLVEDAVAFLAMLDRNAWFGHSVSLNVSAHDLRKPELARVLAKGLAGSSINPSRLILELTERDILRVDAEVKGSLARLADIGAQLAVDDFGTGFSSLSHLLDFQADFIKIDRRFVHDVAWSTTSSSLVRGIVSMAQGLGLTTVAEGVETDDALQRLVELGCDRSQGYLHSPALPADRALAWLADRVEATTQPASH